MLLVLHQGASPQKKMGVAGKILKWDTHSGTVKVRETIFSSSKRMKRQENQRKERNHKYKRCGSRKF